MRVMCNLYIEKGLKMIIIITDIQGDNSNSYISINEATEYFEKDPVFCDIWNDMNDKEKWIVFSARAIDRLSFKGARYKNTQSMEFPRNIIDDNTNDGSIPQSVKDAQCEMLKCLKNESIGLDLKTYNELEKQVIGGTINTVKKLLEKWIDNGYTARLRRI